VLGPFDFTSFPARTAHHDIADLSPGGRAFLDAMSPARCPREVRAPLIALAHDRGDRVIPVGESRRLVRALGGDTRVRYTEFLMSEHLDPTKVRLPPLVLGRELITFVRFIHPLFRQAVQE
jgi:hypothetical protein